MKRFRWTAAGWRREQPAEVAPQELPGGNEGFDVFESLEEAMGKAERISVILEHIKTEGYVPSIDDDGDILFKVEGRSYFVILDEKDEMFYRLVFPNFWSIEDDEERERVIQAATQASAKTKVAKIFPVKDDTWASIELFLSGPQEFIAVFSRSLSALQSAVGTFREAMQSE
ncbi:MAG: hypothetical protein RLZZ436_3366 [Planctomycetota bacterium]